MTANVTIHVGLHKTASTLIQRAIEADAPALSQRLALLTRKVNTLQTVPWFSQTLRKHRTLDQISDGTRREVWSDMRSRGLDPEGEILISSEELLGSFRMDAPGRAYPFTAEFAEAMGRMFGDRTRFVIYFRNPVTYFMATFVQRIQSGHLIQFKKYHAQFTPAKMDWAGVLGDLVHTVGRDRVHCVLYDEIGDGVAAYAGNVLTFHDGLVFSDAAAATFKTRVNKGLSARGLNAAMAAYPFLTESERTDLKRFLQKRLADDATPFFPLSESDLEAFLAESSEGLSTFAGMLDPKRQAIVESWLDLDYYRRYLDAAETPP